MVTRALCIVLIVGWAVDSQAQDRSLAKKHFRKGQQHYTLGRFVDALKAFEAAYEAAPLPAFLFNLAQCHFQTKNYERAIFFYEGYLREKPNAPNRTVVEDLLRDSKHQLELQQAQAREKEEIERREATLRLAEEEKKFATDSETITAVPLEPIPGQAPPGSVSQPTPLYKKWWLWTAVGVVAAGAATGIALGAGGGTRTVLPAGSLGTLDRR